MKSDRRAPQGRAVWAGERKGESSSALWECGNRAFGDFQGRSATVGNSTSSRNSRNCETRVFHRRLPPGISTALFAHAIWPCSVAMSPTHRFCYRASLITNRLVSLRKNEPRVGRLGSLFDHWRTAFSTAISVRSSASFSDFSIWVFYSLKSYFAGCLSWFSFGESLRNFCFLVFTQRHPYLLFAIVLTKLRFRYF
jgi:hypothetical protein